MPIIGHTNATSARVLPRITGVREPVRVVVVPNRPDVLSTVDRPDAYTLSGNAAKVVGPRGLAFDLPDNSVVITTNCAAPTGDFTASILARVDNIEQWGAVWAFGEGGGSTHRCSFQKSDTSNNMAIFLSSGSVTFTGLVSVIADGEWHWHTVCWDGATARYYQDGVQRASGALTGSITSTATDRLLLFRERANNASFEANGAASAFWCVDRCMSPGEIRLRSSPEGEWGLFHFAGDSRTYFIPAAAGGGATTDVPLTTFTVSPQAPTTLRSLISNVPTL